MTEWQPKLGRNEAMTTDPIKALVDLGPELLRIEKLGALEDVYFENVESSPRYVSATQLKTILAAIEALTPIAAGGSVVVPVEPTEAICEKLRAVLPELFDTSDDTLREIYIDMLAAASPSASTGKDGVVERVARAIWNVDAHPARKNWDEAIQSDDYAEALNDCRAYAIAAIAAIKEGE